MNEDEGRLDGNAAGGLLAEIFPFDMTIARAQCAGCLITEPVGAEMVYTDAPGMVIRCLHCQSVLIRVVQGGGRYWVDMRGLLCLEIIA